MVSNEIVANIFAVVVCVILFFIGAFHVVKTLCQNNERVREKFKRLLEIMDLEDDEDE